MDFDDDDESTASGDDTESDDPDLEDPDTLFDSSFITWSCPGSLMF